MLSLKSAPARRRNGPRPPTGPKPMISTGFQRSIAAWIASCRSGGAAVAAGCHQPPATLSHVTCGECVDSQVSPLKKELP